MTLAPPTTFCVPVAPPPPPPPHAARKIVAKTAVPEIVRILIPSGRTAGREAEGIGRRIRSGRRLLGRAGLRVLHPILPVDDPVTGRAGLDRRPALQDDVQLRRDVHVAPAAGAVLHAHNGQAM